MNALIVYYSRSGNTEKVALLLKDKLDADLICLTDKKKRKGIMGFLSGGKDALQKNMSEIEYEKKKLDDYDLICLGTPVWADSMTPALRSFIRQNSFENKKILLFCTTVSSGIKKTFSEISNMLTGSFIVKEIGIFARELKNTDFLSKSIDDKLSDLKSKGG